MACGAEGYSQILVQSACTRAHAHSCSLSSCYKLSTLSQDAECSEPLSPSAASPSGREAAWSLPNTALAEQLYSVQDRCAERDHTEAAV